MPFDMKAHLIKVQGGRTYLPVSARILWFREVHPDWALVTEPLEINHEKQYAVFRATVLTAEGVVMATGTKKEDVKGFGDFIEKAECVPTNTQILTLHGWCLPEDLKIGAMVLSYDVVNDCSEWVPVERVVTYDRADVVRLHNGKGFDATCTPEHKWATFAINNGQARRYEYRALTETSNLKTHHRLTVACPAPSGNSGISSRDASLIGWLITDGSFNRRGNCTRAYICQSKPRTVQIIRDLLADIPHLEKSKEPCDRTFPTGKTYSCVKAYRWYLGASEVAALFSRLGISDEIRVRDVIAGMSFEAREAMFEAMMLADGTEKGDFGKIRHPWVVSVFSQLCALQGKMLCAIKTNSQDFPTQRVKKAEGVYASNLKIEMAGTEDVWCPTTKHGTWYARFDNGMTCITGNTGAIGRALALCGFGTQFSGDFHDGKDEPDSRGEPVETAPKKAQSTDSGKTNGKSNGAKPEAIAPDPERSAPPHPSTVTAENATTLATALFRAIEDPDIRQTWKEWRTREFGVNPSPEQYVKIYAEMYAVLGPPDEAPATP